MTCVHKFRKFPIIYISTLRVYVFMCVCPSVCVYFCTVFYDAIILVNRNLGINVICRINFNIILNTINKLKLHKNVTGK